jgi:hypothetical protein
MTTVWHHKVRLPCSRAWLLHRGRFLLLCWKSIVDTLAVESLKS